MNKALTGVYAAVLPPRDRRRRIQRGQKYLFLPVAACQESDGFSGTRRSTLQPALRTL